MGKFQIVVLLSVVSCAVISTVQSVPVSDSSVVSENADKCKKLCGLCGCTGYYCGDECLCECNSQTDGEAACVDVMKSNCKKMELPFEVMIQGPNVNRMVRSLLYADPAEENCVKSSESNQKKRSTISIYKPDEVQQQDEILLAPRAVVEEIQKDDEAIRVVVAEKSDADVGPVKIEENVQKPECPADDDVERANVKRHIIDVNQEIFEATRDSDDSFIHKRDTDDEVPVEEEPKEEEPKEEEPKEEVVEDGENVGTAKVVAPAAAAAAIVLPKIAALKIEALKVPTEAEITLAFEGVRKELDKGIGLAVVDAKKRAEELRARIATIPAVVAPAAAAAAVVPKAIAAAAIKPIVFEPLKFDPILRTEEVSTALAAAPLAIPAEIAKAIAAFKLVDLSKIHWLAPLVR